MKMQLKNPHFYLMLLSDVLLFAAALTLAYLFRFEFSIDASGLRDGEKLYEELSLLRSLMS